MTRLEDTIAKITDQVASLEEKIKRFAVRDAVGGYWVSMAPWGLLPATGTTVSVAMYLAAVPRVCTLKKLVLASITNTTNDAGNHWEIDVRTQPSGAGGIIAAQSLQADAVGTWTLHTYTTFVRSEIALSDIYIDLECTKVGTPGALNVGGPLLFFI